MICTVLRCWFHHRKKHFYDMTTIVPAPYERITSELAVDVRMVRSIAVMVVISFSVEAAVMSETIVIVMTANAVVIVGCDCNPCGGGDCGWLFEFDRV